MSPLLDIQKYLAIHRKQISKIFLIFEVLLITFWLAVYLKSLDDYRSILVVVYEIGLKLGEIATMLYVVTLAPGIITRLQWFPQLTQPIASIILPFRRHFGILMFLTAFVHLSFTTTLPHFARYDFKPPQLLPPLALFQWMGLIAWLCLLPLWLTSNDLSQKKLGKTWKILHRFTYFALIFIFLHTALQGVIWMYLIGTTLVLEALSWIVSWRRDAINAKMRAQSIPAEPEPIIKETNATNI